MNPSYNPIEFESKIYEKWEESGKFRATSDPKPGQPSYMITMPPPNVTGALHMGHALFVSLQDTFTRWKRMLGYNALWLPGIDHAGIATQVMVERQVESEGTSRQKLGREKFLKRVWEWKEEFGGTIFEQIRSLGASCDWDRELFTLDEKSSRAVRESFTKLYHEGLIYRGERIVNWSSGLQTAISDLEVEQKPAQGALYFMKYALEGNESEFLPVATTRPETVFADVAVAVNPKDERWKKFHGKNVRVPLTDRFVPVVQDEYVDLEFGTGALKITPGHDVNDWNIGQKHKLKTLSCIDKDGKLNALAGPFAGLLAAHSRKKVAEKISELGLLIKEEKHSYELGYCQRTGVVVEPLISMQWFIRMQPLADKAIQAASGEDPALHFYPEYWRKTWFEWLNNIQDWCISRQLWWGHQIPAWHCKKCSSITVPQAHENPTQCGSCQSKEIEQDSDVLDTWYSSALWPLSTLGWPEKTKELDVFYPAMRFDEKRGGREAKALMETGSDILFFWVARMVMMCTHFSGGKLPFEDIFLHAMVRDEKGQKMSKTKGNVIDPLDISEKHGSDALRLTLIALSGQGKNVNLDLKRLEGYKGFINKLWNASRFALMQIQETKIDSFKDPATTKEHDLIDRWLLSELDATKAKIDSEMRNYRPDSAFSSLYQFAWYEFCDWYLELVKIKKGKLDVLCYGLDSLLKLFHPLAPMVTEKIYAELPWAKVGELSLQQYPLPSGKFTLSAEDQNLIKLMKSSVEGIRNFRTENKISPKAQINVYLETKSEDKWKVLSPFIVSLARLGNITVGSSSASGTSGKVVAEEFTFTIPLEGLVDKDAERTRLQNEIQKARADLEFSQKRLGNEAFVAKAKPELVEKERALMAQCADKLKILEEALKKLG